MSIIPPKTSKSLTIMSRAAEVWGLFPSFWKKITLDNHRGAHSVYGRRWPLYPRNCACSVYGCRWPLCQRRLTRRGGDWVTVFRLLKQGASALGSHGSQPRRESPVYVKYLCQSFQSLGLLDRPSSRGETCTAQGVGGGGQAKGDWGKTTNGASR